MKLATAALAVTAAVAVGFGVLTMPAGADAEPSLPPVSAEDLVTSVLASKIPALNGTVMVRNALGLPELPSRVGEQVFIEDGPTLWRYDSSSRTATALEHGAAPAHQVADPAQAARDLVAGLRESSKVAVDGTSTVTGRPVYQLVLTRTDRPHRAA
ncbi:MAG: hypothetical protein WAN20_02015 [Pseudonocardiaceae bacterium]